MNRKSKYHFTFENLLVYQKAMEFGESVYKQTFNFPKLELYGLTAQFNRAVDSIALNIAEGSAASDKNFSRYLKMAWNSAHECVAISTKARLRKYISFEEDEENRRYITEISKMISALRRHLKEKQNKK